ncbi:MAG: hypothetical protein GX662_09320 [Trichococcus flocculiformis]|uniref:AtuA-like ferredoxin-fold domain-containing protein n=1 Tax=Trichococcus flocculiformis TaxID=82803 RepID=A0A847D6A9_9LACT|nr:hypothetical protein [Trichococcus flocculiformis]NLD32433.1 hypothetical protein [Trichococcus flocculiformis]
MKLREICHIRTGDKENDSNLAIIPYDESDFEYIREKLTQELVEEFYQELCLGGVERFEVESVKSLNFVLKDVLKGGVSRSLNIDKHGKSLGMAIGELELQVL